MNPKDFNHQRSLSYLYAANAPFIEELYAAYLQNPEDVPDQWRNYFEQLKKTGNGRLDIDHHLIRNTFAFQTQHTGRLAGGDFNQVVASIESKQVSVLQLINAYRFRGHQQADVDPLHLNQNEPIPDLDPAFHKLTEADMDRVFNTGSLVGAEQATLREILHHLQTTYCGHIGAEYMHITSTSQKRWIQERLESLHSKPQFSDEMRIQILERLIAAEGFEKYLHTKYVGQKRFSLEGAESLIPMMDLIIQRAGAAGIEEIVLGMAHRGRLNVLTNILGKSPQVLFREFEGHFDPSTNEGSGDVKYHQGFSTDIDTPGGPIHLALAFNPSHLEIIYPVVQGSVRARQARRHEDKRLRIMPLVIHGDAAFAGQGVVMETLNMSAARGFKTGGTVHVIINNQIGFTTSNPKDSRSTYYCTEVARMVQAPIFHVNGDDPEAVTFVAQVALDFRNEFRQDVVIDLVCYRRHGHSEADEPAATQPMMYKKIRNHPPVTKIYAGQLIADNVITQENIDKMVEVYRDTLDKQKIVAPNVLAPPPGGYPVDWTKYLKTSWRDEVNTGVEVQVIQQLHTELAWLPDAFELHPRVKKIMTERQLMANGEMRLDWGFAETMAYATLIRDGYNVRLSGQDSGRGTFFHRHAVLHNQIDGQTYIPLKRIAKNTNTYVTIIDSLLSEEAVLGFEYGFSAAEPNTLVIWEAQFGDFANNAQVVIDQFISSGEAKWGRLSGLTLFLPHGYDGQGPEHSSARLERYLQICAEENMQVVVPSTPAQFFHLLRRQMLRPYRKPLIVLTPKSLLRHKESSSALEDLTAQRFHCVIDDNPAERSSPPRRLILCSGKVYFDLVQERQKRQINDLIIVRIEQLYPFPEQEVAQVFKKYQECTDIVWCQEEPSNQGAWNYIHEWLQRMLEDHRRLTLVSRPRSASPAVGYLTKHIEQQREIVDAALR